MQEAFLIVDNLEKYSDDKEEIHEIRANDSSFLSKSNRVASKLQTKSIQEEYKPIQQVCLQLMQSNDYSDNKKKSANLSSVSL